MRRLLAPLLALLDAACIAGGIATAWASWLWQSPNLQHLVQVRYWELWFTNPWMPAGAAYVVAWVLGLRQLGMYDPGRMESSVRIASAVSQSAVYMTVFTIVANFLLTERTYPKALVLPVILASWAYLVIGRLLVFRAILKLEKAPTAEKAAIVGIEEDAATMAQHLAREARHVCTVAGFLRTAASGPAAVPEERILGNVADIYGLVNKHDLHLVILATHMLPRDDAMRLAVQADRMGLRVLQVPYTFGVVSPRLGLARVGGFDLVDLAGIKYTSVAERVKRIFDIVAVLAGSLVVLPIMVFTALAIKLDDGGPVFYVSKRIGRGGRSFPFLKFRSMVVGADKMKADLWAQNESDGRLFKMKKDPRITRIGHFIRKYSVDELPQLVNVLRGDMNLVGPRPLPSEDLAGIEHDAEMRFWFEQRGKVNPGITGLWQVSGRSDTGFAEMVRHDIHYIQDWSLWLDLQILLKTVPAVLRGRGAA